MALFLLKPILWNTAGYLQPSGVRAGGFPEDNGYGHEEWNNSPRMLFREDGYEMRAFHTEEVGNAPVGQHEGQTFVFMTASHDGVQQLVGIAGNATCLAADADRPERERIAKALSVDEFWKDAWAMAGVREIFGTRQAFRQQFNKDVHWIPNWVCPAETFLWLKEPVTLHAPSITGSTQLPKMFSRYKAIELPAAVIVMNSAPLGQRTESWNAIMVAMRCAPSGTAPVARVGPERETSRLAEIKARVGQDRFRNRVRQRWGDACAVSGLTCLELLVASHILPWKEATNRQRLDEENGLLLSAHLDRLFDTGLISFDDSGRMLLSPQLAQAERVHFALPASLRASPSPAMRGYLAKHRELVFRG